MDTTTQPSQPKSRRLPGKKLTLLILALVLAAGATGAYLYRQRPEDKPATNNQQEDTSTNEPEQLEQVDPNDLAARYEYAQSRLEKVDDLNDTDKITLYTNLAYDGAALDKREAREYAQTALDLAPDSDEDDEANKAIRAVLTEIAAGKYDTAKNIVRNSLED